MMNNNMHGAALLTSLATKGEATREFVLRAGRGLSLPPGLINDRVGCGSPLGGAHARWA